MRCRPPLRFYNWYFNQTSVPRPRLRCCDPARIYQGELLRLAATLKTLPSVDPAIKAPWRGLERWSGIITASPFGDFA